MAVGNPAVVAFQQLTGTIPVVFIEVGDSLGSGSVSSTARPGGNITGFELTQPSMGGKWLGVLKEAAPNMSRTAILFGSDGADRDPPLRVYHPSRQTRIASIIVTAHAAPKIATNNRSARDNARPQPRAASTASATSSRKRGFISCSFIPHLF